MVAAADGHDERDGRHHQREGGEPEGDASEAHVAVDDGGDVPVGHGPQTLVAMPCPARRRTDRR